MMEFFGKWRISRYQTEIWLGVRKGTEMMNGTFKRISVAVITSMLLTSELAHGQSLQASNADKQPASQMIVSATKDKDGRQAFQARAFASPQGTGIHSSFLTIPAGKRLIIENVSVIARRPEGLQVEANFFTYIDNDGDGVGDVEEITFHRITFTEQGVFDGMQISTANHKVMVFADTSHVAVQARLNGTTSGFVQIQFTLSGYLEDLPTQ